MFPLSRPPPSPPMCSINTLANKNLKLLQQYKSKFEILRKSGIEFTSDQLLSLDEAHINVLVTWAEELADFKKGGIEVTPELLLALSAEKIGRIGFFRSIFVKLVEAFHLGNHLQQLLAVDDDILNAIFYQGYEFIALKNAGLDFSWADLISLGNKTKIDEVGKYGARFAGLKKSGIEFTWENFRQLTPEQKIAIKDNHMDIIAAKQAGINFSWEQLISLIKSEKQIKIFQSNSGQLFALKKAGIDLNWDQFITEVIKIPSVEEQKKE